MSENQNPHLGDEFCLVKMDFLTWLGKRVLPQGVWSGHEPSNDQSIKPRLYLTFDDGPDPHTTPQLLEILATEKISATFFVVGSQAQKYPELVEQIMKGGHVIGNHTYHHEFMPSLTNKRIETEVQRTNDAVEEVTGVKPTLFRAPYGILDNRVADCLKERAMKAVYWSSVSEDWMPLGAERVVARIKRKLADGALIVLHEAWFAKQTIDSTRGVIKIASNAGFEFASLRAAV